jgi:hypothetical protein
MNILLYFISLFLLFPAIVFAKTSYNRSVPDLLIPSTTVIAVRATDYDKEINCGGLGFWGVQAVRHKTGEVFSSSPRFVSSDVLYVPFTLNIPPGDYEEITFTCSDDGENLAFQYGSLENDLAGDQIIFTASDIPSITSVLNDRNIITATIDGDAISTTFNSVYEDTAPKTTPVLAIPTESPIEEVAEPSSITGDTHTNATTTTTF